MVFFSTILTPGKGFPASSETDPETICCEKTLIEKNKNVNESNRLSRLNREFFMLNIVNLFVS